MAEAAHLAEGLKWLFVTPNVGWFIPFTAAVAGLTAEQAARRPAPGFNSVWMVVNHICFWQEVILNRLQNTPVDPSVLQAGQGWDEPRDPVNQADWEAACERAVRLNQQVAERAANLSDEALARPIETWNEHYAQAIQGLIAHNSYHICEIISIRHMQGWWLENT